MLYTKYHRLLESFAISVLALYLNSKLFSIIFPLIQGFDNRRSIAIILHTGNSILRMDIGFIFCIIVLTAILFKARRFSSRTYAITMVFFTFISVWGGAVWGGSDSRTVLRNHTGVFLRGIRVSTE